MIMATLSFGTPPAKIWMSMKGASNEKHMTMGFVVHFLVAMSTSFLDS